MKIFTIGYEGCSPEAFDGVLRRNRIQCVVDVRAIAASRRKGFAKRALSERLIAQKISYVHLPALGDPKEGRLAARAGLMIKFRKIFCAHMKTFAALEALEALRKLASEKRVALLCFEAEAESCHRSIVSAMIGSPKTSQVVHLTVMQGVGDGSRASDSSHKSLAAA